jgi:hypothetical protein
MKFSNWLEMDRVWLDHPVYGKETVGEFLKRQGVDISPEGTFTLYHGRPKGSDYQELRKGSYLATNVEDAIHYTERDRKDVEAEVIKLILTPDQIDPGVFITLKKNVKIPSNAIVL